MYMVSSCLCGNPCRYDGSAGQTDRYPGISELLARGLAVPICPEVLGSLPVPRPPAEITGGTGRDVLEGNARVLNIYGDDITRNYVEGAKKTLHIALQAGCTKAILKDRSPACGVHAVYDGTFSSNRIPGEGVLAALLRAHGLTVISDEDL
ncbi:MAG TPA: DUF523 domain-containing protein [Firmicutes bacterium]|nr:DUF523 domain-containing protein [Bacillota bacterium]